MTSLTKKLGSAIFVAATCLSTTATAQGLFGSSPADDSFYVSAFVGAGFAGDSSFNGTQDPDAAIPATVGGSVAGADAEVDISYDTDIYFGGAIGYQLPFQFWNLFHPRIEIEVSYLDSAVDGGNFNGGDQVFSGSQEALFIFANNFTDIKWRDDQLIIPYIGGGFGAGIIDTNAFYFPTGAAFAPEPAFVVTGEDTGFATHTTIGATVILTEQFEVYGEARYLTTYGIGTERRFLGGGTADLFNSDLSDRPDGITVSGGLRFRF